jgi:PAS domain S-box-containing protein
MIDISRTRGEGFYRYNWTKPGAEGNDHPKISFVKRFDPYDWIIGTGLYVEDKTEELKQNILAELSKVRFGQEGYIFVNTLDGEALVSNGELMTGGLKLWDVFEPVAAHDLFNKELAMAQVPGGGYIYYKIRKLSDAAVESPKVSFIFGLPSLNWLVGAGVYLDDVEAEIQVLEEIVQKELIRDMILIMAAALLLSLASLVIFRLINMSLQRDFNQFSDFFEKAVSQDIAMDLGNIKYEELRGLAGMANKMQSGKIKAETALREEKEKLKTSEGKFRLLAENSKDLIFRMVLPEGRYDYISPASLEILGYTPQEIMERPFFVRELIHPDWKDWLEERLAEVLRGEGGDSSEYKVIHKSGAEVWVSQVVNLIKDEQGNPVALVGRLSDDTHRKKMEEQLRHSYKMDALGQLSGGIAHDFNNVLAGIINTAQVLQSPRRNLDEKSREMVNLILQAARRAAELTAKLSAFSRRRDPVLTPQDIHPLIEETVSILTQTVDKRLKISVHANAKASLVMGDASELQSALINLGINASHAMPEGGNLIFSTENILLDQRYCDESPFALIPGLHIKIDVEDSGAGIDQTILNRIFEPFFSTKEPGKGTGLGLATVYGAVLDHKGAVTVESKVGTGTCFSLYFPCSHLPADTEKTCDEGACGEGRLLLVDDEEIIRISGKNILEDMGYFVMTAADGKEGVELYRRHHAEIDLVIMDQVMPEMNGGEAFFLMRKINPKVRVIIASGYSREDDIARLRAEGLAGFIKKPYSSGALNRLIQEILSSER